MHTRKRRHCDQVMIVVEAFLKDLPGADLQANGGLPSHQVSSRSSDGPRLAWVSDWRLKLALANAAHFQVRLPPHLFPALTCVCIHILQSRQEC